MRSVSILALVLAGCGASSYQALATSSPPSAIAESRAPAADERPGLGTSWGEQVYSPLTHVGFERASSSPWALVALHYNDAAGIAAHADYLDAQAEPVDVPAGDGGLSVGLLDDAGRLLPGYQTAGRTLVVGEDGARYRIVIHNVTTARFEVVASVDGLDVIDGHPADPARRGYIVEPNGSLVIDGFRTSDRDVAAFRFGKVAESYAAQTAGDRDVGVIGLAFFAERGATWSHVYDRNEVQRRDTADPFPARGYAAPPQ
jgi:hypothetical protein